MTKRKLRKKAEINLPQSPHEGIHTCSKGCKKPGCTRTLRDTIEEQNKQIEALKRDVLEQAEEIRQLRFKRVHDLHHIREQCEEIASLKKEIEEHDDEAETLYDFMSRFDWILCAHNCKGGASETHAKLDALRTDYLAWKHPEEERGL